MKIIQHRNGDKTVVQGRLRTRYRDGQMVGENAVSRRRSIKQESTGVRHYRRAEAAINPAPAARLSKRKQFYNWLRQGVGGNRQDFRKLFVMVMKDNKL